MTATPLPAMPRQRSAVDVAIDQAAPKSSPKRGVGSFERLLDVARRVRRRNEARFELRGREVDAAVQHGAEVFREEVGVGLSARFQDRSPVRRVKNVENIDPACARMVSDAVLAHHFVQPFDQQTRRGRRAGRRASRRRARSSASRSPRPSRAGFPRAFRLDRRDLPARDTP